MAFFLFYIYLTTFALHTPDSVLILSTCLHPYRLNMRFCLSARMPLHLHLNYYIRVSSCLVSDVKLVFHTYLFRTFPLVLAFVAIRGLE